MRNKLYDAYDGMGPGEAEKRQILGSLLETAKAKPRKGFNRRPLAILAAGIAMFILMSAPFVLQWARPPGTTGEGDPAGSIMGIDPGSPTVSAGAPVSPGGVILLTTVSFPDRDMGACERIEINSLYQNIIVTFTDSERLEIRQYDLPAAKEIVCGDGPGTISVSAGDKQADRIAEASGARFEVDIPLAFRGSVELGSVSGNIRVGNGARWDVVNIGTVSGNITLSALEAWEVHLGSVSGGITADKVVCETYSAGTVSGSIQIDEITGNGTASSMSGTVKINGVLRTNGFDGFIDWNGWGKDGDFSFDLDNLLGAHFYGWDWPDGWDDGFDAGWLEEQLQKRDEYLEALEKQIEAMQKDLEKRFDGKDWSMSDFVTNRYTPATGEVVLRSEFSAEMKDVASVEIGSLYQNIVVSFADTQTFIIRQYDFADAKELVFNIIGGELKAETPENSFNGGVYGTGNVRIEVELPQSFRGDVTLHSVSGDLTVKDSARLGMADFGSVGGDIRVGSLEATDITLHAVSGDVTAETLICETYDVSSVSGNVTVGSVTGEGEASSVSGTVKVNGESVPNAVDRWSR